MKIISSVRPNFPSTFLRTVCILWVFLLTEFIAHSQTITEGTLDIVTEFAPSDIYDGKRILPGFARVGFYLDTSISDRYMTLDSLKIWFLNSQFIPATNSVVVTSDVEIKRNVPIAAGQTRDMVVVGLEMKILDMVPAASVRWTMKSSASKFYQLFSGHNAVQIPRGKFVPILVKQATAPKIDLATTTLSLRIEGPTEGKLSIKNLDGNPVLKGGNQKESAIDIAFTNGLVNVKDIVSGNYSLVLEAKGFVSKTVPFLILDASKTVHSESIVLEPDLIPVIVQVTTDKGLPLDEFKVTLTDMDSRTDQNYTGKQSKETFRFKPGVYEITVFKDGYQKQTRTLSLKAGSSESLQLSFQLKKQQATTEAQKRGILSGRRKWILLATVAGLVTLSALSNGGASESGIPDPPSMPPGT